MCPEIGKERRIQGACVRACVCVCVCVCACIDHLTEERAWQEFISLV